MLIRLLETIRSLGGAVTLDDLSQRLDVPEEVIAAQLEVLVRKGRLRREEWGGTCALVAPGEETRSGVCRLCPLRAYCAPSRAPLGVVYVVDKE